MNTTRFYKGRGYRLSLDFDPVNTFIKIDSNEFKKPSVISLEKVGEILQLKLSEDLVSSNISAVEFTTQNINPELPPNTIPVALDKTHIAIDDNYLYVWAKNKWKRIPLSDWD